MTSGTPDTRKKRFSHDEASVALIDAGKKLLVERGLDAGLGLVSLNDAIIEAGVPRASAYRAFTNDDLDPQVAFRSQLIAEFIRDQARHEAGQKVADRIRAGLTILSNASPEELSAGIREQLRTMMEANVERLLHDSSWHVVGPSWAAASLSQHADPTLIEAHKEVGRRAKGREIPLYREVLRVCGWRLREGMTLETLAVLIESCTTAGSFYGGFDPGHRIQRATGENGESVPWTTAAIMLEGLLYTCVEPDPEAASSIDLRRWLES